LKIDNRLNCEEALLHPWLHKRPLNSENLLHKSMKLYFRADSDNLKGKLYPIVKDLSAS